MNGTRNLEVKHEFALNCDVGWISEPGFYQIGPAADQLQVISDDKNEVFV